MFKNIRIAVLFAFIIPFAFAQSMTAEQYIEKYKDAAMQNMREKKVPASITLAQGILESGNGNSDLAVKANNHFGIKCHTGWTGGTFYKDDDAPNECFRKYKSVLESYEDHANFLITRERYKSLFSLEITDYKGWATGLKAAGYATNPKYPELLINLIERYQLHQYDRMALGTTSNTPTNNTNNSNPTNNTPSNNTTPNFNTQGTGLITMNNGLRMMVVKAGQTKAGIALDFALTEKKIEKYNELGAGDLLYDGQLIYLDPKKNSAEKGKDYHTVQPGETFYSIAQLYGMNTPALMKKNNAWYGTVLKAGDRLYLRKNKPLK